jgi:DMSO/TMAO reductase YedYZ molybdopterin-dependent catalytic subunit
VIRTRAPDDIPPRGVVTGRRPSTPKVTLPPGQRLIEGFPRFGAHLARPAPRVPVAPVIQIRGAVTDAFDVPLATLATLPRRNLTADFHCVAGWSATNLSWEGVSFETFYRIIIAPALPPDTAVTHVVFRGLDGYRSVVLIEDALGDGVLIAERLGGRPLDGDHGAPARLVSPAQYGYISTKHLCRVEICTAEPEQAHATPLSLLFRRHPRARVWDEERHGCFPAWSIRPLYRALKAPFLFICARGSAQGRPPPPR